MIQEFKEFVSEKSLLEVAVGLVLALAFTAMVNSLVEGLLMPLIAAAFGEPSFDALTFEVNGSTFFYGTFITQVINFLLVAAALFFFVVKPLTALVKKDESPG